MEPDTAAELLRVAHVLTVAKSYRSRRPLTTASATVVGGPAFARHVAPPEHILQPTEPG